MSPEGGDLLGAEASSKPLGLSKEPAAAALTRTWSGVYQWAGELPALCGGGRGMFTRPGPREESEGRAAP